MEGNTKLISLLTLPLLQPTRVFPHRKIGVFSWQEKNHWVGYMTCSINDSADVVLLMMYL